MSHDLVLNFNFEKCLYNPTSSYLSIHVWECWQCTYNDWTQWLICVIRMC